MNFYYRDPRSGFRLIKNIELDDVFGVAPLPTVGSELYDKTAPALHLIEIDGRVSMHAGPYSINVRREEGLILVRRKRVATEEDWSALRAFMKLKPPP